MIVSTPQGCTLPPSSKFWLVNQKRAPIACGEGGCHTWRVLSHLQILRSRHREIAVPAEPRPLLWRVGRRIPRDQGREEWALLLLIFHLGDFSLVQGLLELTQLSLGEGFAGCHPAASGEGDDSPAPSKRQAEDCLQNTSGGGAWKGRGVSHHRPLFCGRCRCPLHFER